MTFMVDTQELKDGLVIFRRTDVQHQNWYCRMKLPGQDRYKFVSLETPILNEARDKAFDEDAELRFKVKHELPVFNRQFSQVAKEYSDFHKTRVDAGQITFHRWRVMHFHIKTQLNPYVGTTQITLIGQDKWDSYPVWRQQTGKGRSGGKVSGGTIRSEMDTFRSIMRFAAAKHYIRESQVFKGKLPKAGEAREEFTPEEYRKLYTFARTWMNDVENRATIWTRTMVYNFMLIMTNTGMRPKEARNLRWRDVGQHTDKHGREFTSLSVRAKGKHRVLVGTPTVWKYFERVRKLSKKTASDDFVFTTEDGKQSKTLYHGPIERLLTDSKLLMSTSGKRRSTYCFRHTYATFRLASGTPEISLANQMGTSVQMLQQHYGHITSMKNPDLVLNGLPGWDPVAVDPALVSVEPELSSDGAEKGKKRPKKPKAPDGR